MSQLILQQIKNIEQKIVQTRQLLQDPQMGQIAAEEITQLEKQKSELEKSSAINEISSVILEIRAAAGGEEAGLFAADLYRMYTKFATGQSWKITELDRTEGGIGNIKTVVAKIAGAQVYQKLKNESGVHRVQRVPKTESSGRIHTSTTTVAVLAEVKPTEFYLNPKDLKFEAFRASGHGGQNVNKVSTAVRLTHKPTGVAVKAQTERSQHQNRELAMEILRAKLWQVEEEKKQKQIANQRREQVGTGERSEKIRTYNFPQNRVTDHRLNKSWYNLENILDGNLEPVISSLSEN